jgi:rSAM/selenodomain-associated transferase 1
LGEKHALVIMAKEPVAGQTKTRLSPPLTAERASELYACFLQDITTTVRHVSQANPNIDPYFGFSPANAAGYFQTLASDFGRITQIGERLNERLQSVFDAGFIQGYCMVAAINSDSPTLPEAYLIQAFERLEKADIVLGPCEDGGYYLIGLKRPIPEIILPVQMSTAYVLTDTLALIKEQGLSVELLPTWYDVDTAEELDRLQQELIGKESRTAAWFGQ